MAMITFDKYGETPLDDISGLKLKNIKTRAQLDDAEAHTIFEVTLYYSLDPQRVKRLKFNLDFFKKLHKQMFGKVWSWAGEYRTTQTTIGVEAKNIIPHLYQLTDDLVFWENNWDYQDTATRLHHTLVKIHPFPNGNGRWSRMVTDMWLMRLEKNPLSWGSEYDLSLDGLRERYIDALKDADLHDYRSLKSFMFG
jgi:Fic-DOC domain mobile mystery protein B